MIAVVTLTVLLGAALYIANLYRVEADNNAEEARANRWDVFLEQGNTRDLAINECNKVEIPSDVRVIDGFVKSRNETESIGNEYLSGNVNIELKCLYDYRTDLVWHNVTYTIDTEFQHIDEYNKEWRENQTQQLKLN